MVDINKLSSTYYVRRLEQKDIDAIYELTLGNPTYYNYCPPYVTKESILSDMKALPPHKGYNDKYYIGFYDKENLIAIMDIIFDYPNNETAFIGFFMVRNTKQGEGIGTKIINECFEYISKQGYNTVRLCFVKGNLQSESFWNKNGFVKTGKEENKKNYTTVVMEKNI